MAHYSQSAMILNLSHSQKNGNTPDFTQSLDVYVSINPFFVKLFLPGIGHNGMTNYEAENEKVKYSLFFI